MKSRARNGAEHSAFLMFQQVRNESEPKGPLQRDSKINDNHGCVGKSQGRE